MELENSRRFKPLAGAILVSLLKSWAEEKPVPPEATLPTDITREPRLILPAIVPCQAVGTAERTNS